MEIVHKNIVANHGGNRAVAANALLHMGQCYEKLGKAEARKAYQKVLRRDSPQTALLPNRPHRFTFLLAQLHLIELYQVTARIIKYSSGYRPLFFWFLSKHHAQLFQPFVLFLNIVNSKCR